MISEYVPARTKQKDHKSNNACPADIMLCSVELKTRFWVLEDLGSGQRCRVVMMVPSTHYYDGNYCTLLGTLLHIIMMGSFYSIPLSNTTCPVQGDQGARAYPSIIDDGLYWTL